MLPSLSLTGKQWRLSRAAQKQRGVHEIIALLCREREIIPREQRTLTSPSVFPDITRAVERIQGAIAKGERVGIFGDYDCDGVTAVTQLVRFFRRHGVEPFVRLPHRMRDGYGLNLSIVDEICAADIQLLITADTGIGSVEEIAALQEQGIEVGAWWHKDPKFSDEYTINKWLRQHVLEVPIHQGLTRKDLKYIVKRLLEAKSDLNNL